jgi:hypothetical protein
VVLWGAPGHTRHVELPNHIPEARETLAAAPHQDMLHVPDATQPNLGWGAGGYQYAAGWRPAPTGATQAIRQALTLVETPGDGQPQPPPDAALPTSTQTARP